VSVASSVSTFLDVTRAARGAGSTPSSPVFMNQTAQVLAAINRGAHDVATLSKLTGLEPARIVATLSWLSDAGMIKLATEGDRLRADLTEPTEKALRDAEVGQPAAAVEQPVEVPAEPAEVAAEQPVERASIDP
jgi:hypothetical protein